MISTDGNVELQMLSFEAPKIRLLRSLSIESQTMQVVLFNLLICIIHDTLCVIKREGFPSFDVFSPIFDKF